MSANPPTPPHTHTNMETARVQFFCWQCRDVHWALPDFSWPAFCYLLCACPVGGCSIRRSCCNAWLSRVWLQGDRLLGPEFHALPAVSAICFSSSNCWAIQCVVHGLVISRVFPRSFPHWRKPQGFTSGFLLLRGPCLAAGLRKLQTSRVFALMAEGKRS